MQVSLEQKNNTMKKIIRKFIKGQIKSLHEGRRVVKVYQSWKRGEKANLNDLGEGNYGFDPRAIAQYFTPDGIAKEDVSVFGMSNGSVELHTSSDKDRFHEAEVKGDVVNLHYKIDVYASPSDGDMSSVIDYVQNNEVVRKYGIKVEVGALESGPQEDESSVYVKFSLDRSKRGGTMTAIRLLRDVVIEFIEKKIGAVAVDIEARDFKPDGPSDDEYDQMAQQSSMDDRRQQGMDPGLEETARDLGYLGEKQDSDVKSINMVYTDDGRFYGFNIYSMPGLSGNRNKLSSTEEVNQFLQSKGIKMEIPQGYDEDILDQIVAAFRQQGIEAQHNDYMDVSEAYTSEWDPETAARNQEYIRKDKKEDQLKIAQAAYDKAEMNGDIRGMELALAVMDIDKPFPGLNKGSDRIRNLAKSKKLKEMASELGYMNEGNELSRLIQISSQASVKMGEDKLYKLAMAWEAWNVDNDDKYDDLVDPLFAAVELIQDAGTVKNREYYMYLRSAKKHLKQFNMDVASISENNLNEEELNEYTIDGGQSAARSYPKTEDPGDMFAQKEVEELLPASFKSRNQELKARLQAHANWAKESRYNNTFVHAQSNTVVKGNNTFRVAMSQHYNGNYKDFKNPKFTEIRVKELDGEMETDLGYYVVDTDALMKDLRNLETISRQS